MKMRRIVNCIGIYKKENNIKLVYGSYDFYLQFVENHYRFEAFPGLEISYEVLIHAPKDD